MRQSLQALRSWTRHPRGSSYLVSCPFSNVVKNGVKIPYYHDGLLKVDFSETDSLVRLTVVNTWRDDCELLDSTATSNGLCFSSDEVSKSTTLLLSTGEEASVSSSDDSVIGITLSIPEYCNLQVKGKKMDLIQEKKLQGNVDVDIQKGNILVNKVRGHTVRLNAWEGNVTVKTSIEGNVEVTGKTVNIKMMNVDSLNLHALKLHVEAIYSKAAEIVTYGDAEINHMQGSCSVTSDCGDLNLSGIEGRFTALAHEGDIALQINRLHASNHHPASADSNVNHVAAQESSAVASKGSIFARIAPTVTTKLRLESLHSLPGFSMPAAGDADAMPMVTVEAPSLTHEQRSVTSAGTVVTGTLVGRSSLASSPSSKRKSATNSGKINVLSHIDAQVDPAAVLSATESSIAMKAGGFVRLEALSWMDSIKRRHGLDDK